MIDATYLAVIIVGFTEILKSGLSVKSKILKILTMTFVSVAVVALYVWQGDNDKLFVGLTAVASATLGYDLILGRLMHGHDNTIADNSSIVDNNSNTRKGTEYEGEGSQ